MQPLECALIIVSSCWFFFSFIRRRRQFVIHELKISCNNSVQTVRIEWNGSKFVPWMIRRSTYAVGSQNINIKVKPMYKYIPTVSISVRQKIIFNVCKYCDSICNWKIDKTHN